MVIDLNKCMHRSKVTLNFTNVPLGTLYFLFQVNDTTPRYRRTTGGYVEDPNGSIVIDYYDVWERAPRVLMYIGESKRIGSRLTEHCDSNKNIKNIKTGLVEHFNYIRILTPFKRFQFDTVRNSEESRLVRIFIPKCNLASRFNDEYKKILLNSGGAVQPRDLIYPNVLHARDIYQAYIAWEKEDPEYLKKYISPPDPNWRKGTMTLKGPVDYYLYGVKRKFGRFFRDVVEKRHIKTESVYQTYQNNLKKWTKQYIPDIFEMRRKRNSDLNKSKYRKRKEQKNVVV